MKITALVVALLSTACQAAWSAILGHSNAVLHLDRYGHYDGLSSHYDYRYYPEKTMLDYMVDYHQEHPLDNGYYFGLDPEFYR